MGLSSCLFFVFFSSLHLPLAPYLKQSMHFTLIFVVLSFKPYEAGVEERLYLVFVVCVCGEGSKKLGGCGGQSCEWSGAGPSSAVPGEAAVMEMEFLLAGRIPAPAGLRLACSLVKLTLGLRRDWIFQFPAICELL